MRAINQRLKRMMPNFGSTLVYCPRCGKGGMVWTQSSWYCPHCQFKEGCCG